MLRMDILNTPEREDFDSPPEFTSVERKAHFSFPLGILERADQLRTPTKDWPRAVSLIPGLRATCETLIARRLRETEIGRVSSPLAA
jgi:hypothetical protein